MQSFNKKWKAETQFGFTADLAMKPFKEITDVLTREFRAYRRKF